MEKLNKKIADHGKYITNAEFNKFSGEIFDAKLKRLKLATNPDLINVEQCVIEK